MPPKRVKKKSKQDEVKPVKTEQANQDEPPLFAYDDFFQRILSCPSLKIKEIVERGSATTMAKMSAEFSESSDWLHAQKAKLKEILRRAGFPEKSIPKTPRRGVGFARYRETAEMYSSYSLVFEEQSTVGVELEDEQATNYIEPEPSGPATDAESSYEDASHSLHGEAAVEGTEPVQTTSKDPQENGVEDALQTSGTYITANEDADGIAPAQRPVLVKAECISPPTEDLQQHMLPSSTVDQTPVSDVKREVFSSKQDHTVSRVRNAETPPRRVLRSTSRAKTAVSVSTVTRPHVGDEQFVSPSRTRQNTISTAATTGKEKEMRAAAGASHTRLQRVVHQHVVTTPCKPEYKTAVMRAVQRQELARTLSPRRAPTRTPSSTRTTRTLRATGTQQAAKHKTDDQTAKRTKEADAARTREEQCRERAERIRKEREEKALKAQQNRKQMEAAEKLKAEALKRKEERDERRLEEVRLKSPARSKAPSRVVSPARVPKMVANAHPRSPAKVLFPSTPGRVPAKIARVVGASGETSRQPTMNTPSRDSRRKPFPSKLARFDSDGSTGDCLSNKKATHLQADCEERVHLQEEEEGSGERLNDERKRLLRLNGREHLYMENIKMEVDVVVNPAEELQFNLLRVEQGDASMEVEDGRNVIEDGEERECENAFMQEQLRRERLEEERKKEEEIRLEEERKEEERRLDEERKRVLMEEQKRLMEEQQKRLMEEQRKRLLEEQLREEQKLREEAEARKRERQIAEEEEAKRRLNVTSSADLHNRHFDNVSFNVSSVHDKSSSRPNSYEITPDKKHKPATENDYNIEDLSSGDETDQEDAPRKKVPSWAEGLRFRRAVERMTRKLRDGEFDPDIYFGEIMAPDLGLIFGTTKRYPRRGSSGIWESPIGKPRPGVGAFQHRLNNKY
ncbi:hypothetical protein Y032_0016g3004 [Ancylostoma ceylanicum]|uniref:Inner centromere protein ARK-binding domain-containing protein n=1 Tax=Ancylostoma ceylanicum TaxID=53326 RepID=A0A016V5D2_9BILA|nr:hypothetical protein Y032_0016g3004 [Ancylostoma ceylanicum]